MSGKIKFLLVTLLAFAAVASAQILQRNGKAMYVLAHPAEPHPTEVRAAREVAEYLQKITGAEFKIYTEKNIPGGSAVIYVGQTDFARKNGVDFSGFAPEEWLIRTTSDNNLILTGGKYVGMFYAAVDYLERQFGVRWLDESCEVVPKNPAAVIGKWDLRRKPSFFLRQVFDMLDWDLETGRFKERNKGFSYTQHETGVSKYYGGNRPYHTAGEYAEDWPRDKVELFTRNAKGEAMPPEPGGGGGGQICLSNMEARQRVLDKMLAYIERDRKIAEEKRCAPPWLYDFSENDNPNKCACENCMKMAEKFDSYGGLNLDFVNWVARGVAKKYPHIMVKTFAYGNSNKPPQNIVAEPNLMIQIALGGVEFGGNYGVYDTMRAMKSPLNKIVLGRFRDWSAKSKNLMHWQYWTLYPVVPEPTLHVNAFISDIQTDRECNITGFFAEYENPAFNSFSVLTRWLAFKMTDDIDADPQKLINEFMNGYYGPAAPYMRQLLDYMEMRQEKYDAALGHLLVGMRPYLDDEYFATTLGLIRKAEKAAAGDQAIIDRVRLELPCLLAGLLSRWPYLTDHTPYDPQALLEEFRTEAHKAMKRFFKDDPQNFRKSERFDAAVDAICRDFQMELVDQNVNLPKGVTLSKETRYLSLGAWRFLYEAKGKLVDDPQAFGGKACSYEYGGGNPELSFANWMEGEGHAKFPITEKLLPKDGKYHWVDVGTIYFRNNGRYNLLIPPSMQGIRCEFFRMILPDTTYKAYISLKWDNKTIWADRVLLIQVANAPRKAGSKLKLPGELEAQNARVWDAGSLRSAGIAQKVGDAGSNGQMAFVNTAPAHLSRRAHTDFGFYSPGVASESWTFTYSHKLITNEEFNLIKLGTFTMPKKAGAYLFCGSDWQIQWPIPADIRGKKGTLYLNAKFTGPAYRRGSTQPNSLTIDYVVFVED